jgi:hypothetical protein
LKCQEAEREKLDGVWVSFDTVVYLKFGGDGIARIAGLDWKDDHFVMGKGELIVTEGKNHKYICVRFQEDEKWKEDYMVAEYDVTDTGELLVWMANPEAFGKAVENKRIGGTIEKDGFSTSVVITDPPEKLLSFIDDSDDCLLFLYGKPFVFRKLPREAESRGVRPGKAERKGTPHAEATP